MSFFSSMPAPASWTGEMRVLRSDLSITSLSSHFVVGNWLEKYLISHQYLKTEFHVSQWSFLWFPRIPTSRCQPSSASDLKQIEFKPLIPATGQPQITEIALGLSPEISCELKPVLNPTSHFQKYELPFVVSAPLLFLPLVLWQITVV